MLRSDMLLCATLLYTLVASTTVIAFTTPTKNLAQPSRRTLPFSSRRFSSSSSSNSAPDRNPDKPELPVVPGDYDWDTKYSGDADWLVGGAVPGKKVLNEIELASQVTALGGLEEKWRKERIATEYADSINVGWVPTAELANGRTAMFFLVTGLLTEYWTGVSLPGQVEELLRISGVIGL